jgi:Down syndrome cell adhesion molecule
MLPSLGVNISNLDQYTSILSITSLMQTHTGNYTCVASNQADEVKFTATLLVKGNVQMANYFPK